MVRGVMISWFVELCLTAYELKNIPCQTPLQRVYYKAKGESERRSTLSCVASFLQPLHYCE